MPSQKHDSLVQLFRNRPSLAAELLAGVLKVDVPAFTEARIDSPDLTETTPTEYRADFVVRLLNGKSVMGLIVEVQLSKYRPKRFAWPAYAAGLRARLKCPVCLIVVAINDSVARWARKPIDMGGGNWFKPLVLNLSAVPEITDMQQAIADPELAVLSAMAHGKGADDAKAIQIALAAQAATLRLDADRIRMYADLIMSSLSKTAKQTLKAMKPANYQYQSDFAKHYVAEGEAKGIAKGVAKGEARGRAAMVIRQLSSRFGTLPVQVTKRIGRASLEELDSIGVRLLTAKTLNEALGRR